jgi:tetratricopeptide (TPR) repeat protein
LESLGDLAEAQEQYSQLHAVLVELAKNDPDQNRAKRNLSLSFNKLGNASLLKGDQEAARKYYAESRKLREGLVSANPSSLAAKIDLATSYVNLGNASEPQEAQSLFEQALKLRLEIAADAPEAQRPARRRDVWIVYNRLAELSLKQGDRTTARGYYDKALAVAQELVTTSSDRKKAQHELADSYVRVATVQLPLGETVAAKENWSQALAILRPLAKEDPENLELQVSHLLALARYGDHATAASAAEKLRILGPQNYRILYNVACCYSLCAAAVALQANDNPLPSAEEELRRSYADKALHTLLEAVAYGLKGEAAVASDPDLAAVVAHPEYPKLLAALRPASASP